MINSDTLETKEELGSHFVRARRSGLHDGTCAFPSLYVYMCERHSITTLAGRDKMRGDAWQEAEAGEQRGRRGERIAGQLRARKHVTGYHVTRVCRQEIDKGQRRKLKDSQGMEGRPGIIVKPTEEPSEVRGRTKITEKTR